ncbi:MAG: YihA family ribosome biogenesis GTP-binding protein [Ruminococcus sp.]|nr:YihA family ribosome biogenesis GTP-binding protein [Ruminococcus sp.]MBQ7134187.1 YihA family ribosome biogenesis GTP-binding protein [Ruminococcus sp.]
MINFNKAEFISAAGTSSQLQVSDKPEVIFSGRSNVGKSSLINKLVNRKALARVSATPGKTATINFFDVDKFCLVDLPGYGYAKVSRSEKDRWAELMEGYFAQDRNFCLVVQIVDMRHKPTEDDLNMIDFLYNSGFEFIIVMTKKDKLKKTAQKESIQRMQDILADYEGIKLYPFSALNGEGTDDIREAISEYVENFNSQG